MTRAKKTTAAPAAESDFHVAHVRDDGVHLYGEGGLPLNHRLRAEALVAAGAAEDPDGLIGPELIADTAKRLAAEAAEAAEEAAADPPIIDPPIDKPAEGSTDQ